VELNSQQKHQLLGLKNVMQIQKTNSRTR